MAFVLTVVPSLPTGWQLQTWRLSLTGPLLCTRVKKRKTAFFHSFNTRASQGAVLSSIIEIISHLRKRKVALFQLKGPVTAHWAFHESDRSGQTEVAAQGPAAVTPLCVPLLFGENSWAVF